MLLKSGKHDAEKGGIEGNNYRARLRHEGTADEKGIIVDARCLAYAPLLFPEIVSRRCRVGVLHLGKQCFNLTK